MRLAHAENNDEGTLKSFADNQIALDTQVVTDGLASYNSESLGQRPHQAVIQTKQERRESDALQGCHWTVSLLKRWLLGTHAGAVRPKHLQAYLDEFAFRFNRRKTKRRRPHRGPHHRAAGRPPTAHDENADPGNGALSSFPELTA